MVVKADTEAEAASTGQCQGSPPLQWLKDSPNLVNKKSP